MAITAWMLALALTAQAAPPQASSRQASPDSVEDVTVTAPNADRVEGFVGELLEPARLGRSVGQIARWNSELCVRVIGGAPDVNARLSEQIIDSFHSLNMPLQAPHCRTPNVMVVIADNASGFARVFTERYRNRFFANKQQDMAEFAEPARPVRWGHRTRTAGLRPSSITEVLAGTGNADGAELPNARLSLSTAEEIDRAMIVIDPRRLAETPSRGVADYVAFATLLDMPQLPAVAGQNTILNLFQPGGPTRMTAWDRALIAGVYSMTPGQPFRNQQSQIARVMRHSLSGGDGAR